MTLRLVIENMDRLPDGGPLRVEVKARGLDIGRDAHLDWTLPDPSRYVSGKHCEVRYRDGDYWLHDVSTNGTFVNGAQFRLEAPHRLRDGDRLAIGPYIVAVAVEGGKPEAAPAVAAQAWSPQALTPQGAPAGDVWGGVGDVAPEEGREAYRVRNKPATPGDFLDFAAEAGFTPPTQSAAMWSEPAAAAPDEDWLRAPPAPPPAPPPPPDPRELPLIERPRPIRPAAAAPVFEAPPPVFEAAPPPFETPAPPIAAEPPPVAVTEIRAQPPGDVSLLVRIAAAAGLPASALAGRDPGEVADEIGKVLRLTAENLLQLAASRRQTKSAIRSTQHTMFQRSENNPIKFAADANHALETMFGPPSRIHLRAPVAVAQVFEETKAHTMLTYGAMQAALDALFAELAPEKIETAVEPERGLGAMMASRKSKLWDAYAERWRAMTKRADGRLNDAFMALFAEAYDRLSEKSGGKPE